MIIAGFFMALVITMLMIPLVRRQAIRTGMYDVPGERKIHKYPVPRLGGVAIFGGFVGALALSMLIFKDISLFEESVLGILLGGLLIFLLGLVDDLKNISPYVKLVIQLGAALLAFYLGVQISTLDLPGSKLLMLHALSLPVTVIWIVALANAMNFIDGLDGLAAGVTVVGGVTLALIAVFTGKPDEAVLGAMLAGAAMGFLAFNFYPARIFMGDSGSLFCGFMLAAVSVTGVLKTKVVVMLLPLVILGVPILDITFSVFRRLARGQNPFIADASHIHHQFLKAGLTQVRTVSYLYALCIIGGMIATGYVNYLAFYVPLILLLLVLGAGLVWLARRVEPLPPEVALATDDEARAE